MLQRAQVRSEELCRLRACGTLQGRKLARVLSGFCGLVSLALSCVLQWVFDGPAGPGFS